MRKIIILFAVMVIVFFVAGCAGTATQAKESKNLIVNGNAADGLKNWTKIQKVVDDGPSGGKCFEVTERRSHVMTKEFIEIDPKGEYILSGMFKSGNEKPNKVSVYLLFFDKNKREIVSTSVKVLPKSETVLMSEVKKGEMVIQIKDVPGWESLLNKRRIMVAFDVDDSGEYNDLPNYNYYEAAVMKQKNGVIEVTLNRTLEKDYATGTNLRVHWKSGRNVCVFAAKCFNPDWTKFSGKIKPAVKSGAPRMALWPKTKYVKVYISANWGQSDGEVLKFTNFSLEKVESGK